MLVSKILALNLTHHKSK